PFFPSKDDANTFLGLLDSIFMAAYAAVRYPMLSL
uniref:Dolichol kinase n=1 Tax=Steinernema glaseri TaxID=37863 RepID=A0A1I7XXA6_9BILA